MSNVLLPSRWLHMFPILREKWDKSDDLLELMAHRIRLGRYSFWSHISNAKISLTASLHSDQCSFWKGYTLALQDSLKGITQYISGAKIKSYDSLSYNSPETCLCLDSTKFPWTSSKGVKWWGCSLMGKNLWKLQACIILCKLAYWSILTKSSSTLSHLLSHDRQEQQEPLWDLP